MPLREGTLAAACAAAQSEGVRLSDIYIRQEAQLSGRPESELRELMRARIQVMRQSLERGLAEPQQSRSGLVRGGAARMRQWMDQGTPLLA